MAKKSETLVVEEPSLFRALLSRHLPLGTDEFPAELHARGAFDLILVDAEEGSDLLAALHAASRDRCATRHES